MLQKDFFLIFANIVIYYYLNIEFSSQILLFSDDVQKFKLENDEKLKEKAENIFSLFLTTHSEMRIQITFSQRKKIKELISLDQVKRDIFEDIESENQKNMIYLFNMFCLTSKFKKIEIG